MTVLIENFSPQFSWRVCDEFLWNDREINFREKN